MPFLFHFEASFFYSIFSRKTLQLNQLVSKLVTSSKMRLKQQKLQKL